MHLSFPHVFLWLVVHFFLVLGNISSFGCATVKSIHSPTEGHLDCFQISAIMNKAAINIQKQVFLYGYTFSTPLGKHQDVPI